MFEAIVVGTDGSQTATTAVDEAVRLAAAVGARLEIVSAYEPVPASRLRAEAQQAPPDVQWTIGPREDVESLLADCAQRAEAAGVGARTHARQGDPADAILDVAEETSADLDRRRQQGHDRRQALPARLSAEQGQPPRALLGADHPDELAERRRGAVAGVVAAPASSRPQP